MLGSVLLHTLSSDLKAAIERSRAIGFGGIVVDPVAFPAVTEPSRSAQREIIHLLSRAGLTLVAIDIRMGSAGLSKDADREVERVARAIDVARGLGTSLVLCDLGPLPPAPDEPSAPPKPAISKAALGGLILPDPPAPAAPPPPPLPRDPLFEGAIEYGLRAIGERADRAGCIVAFRASLGSYASLAAALTVADCPFFGIDLDPLNLLADAWSLDAVCSRLGPQLRHVRARDGLKGANGRTVAVELSTGHVEWPALIEALRDSDYRGAITIDPSELPVRPADAVVRGAKRLEGWLA